jgi:hypothetical protein
VLRAEGLEETVGYFGRRISVADIVDEFEGRVPPPQVLPLPTAAA